MNRTHFLRVVLIAALCMSLAAPAGAQVKQVVAPGASIGPNAAPIIAAVIAVAVAVVVVTVVVIHEASKKRAITGCVIPKENGMSVTDEKDKRVYALSGNTTDIKAGERVTLQGKKAKSTSSNKILTWEVSRQTKDLGTCQP